MPIAILQNDAYKFDADFLNQLPFVEKAMLARNINPSAFTIAKSATGSRARFELTAQCFDYTVTIGDESFTVTYPGDQSFLEFFLAQCVAGETKSVPATGPGFRQGRKRPMTPLRHACIIKQSAVDPTDGQLSSGRR